MATLSKMSILIDADASPMRKQIDWARRDVSKFGLDVGRSSGVMSSGFLAGGAAAGVAMVAVQKVTSAITSLASRSVDAAASFTAWGVQLAAQAEMSAVAFKVLTGSAVASRQVLADIEKFAAETPFEFSELERASRSLLAFNVEAEDLIPTLTMIGDVSAGIGAPIGEIAEIFGKAKVQGRLFMEDINQLTGRGIPIIQELAKQFRVAESDIRKLVEQGAVNFGHLQAAFEAMTTEGGRFAGLMSESSKTTQGQWSTLNDDIKMLAKAFGETLLPAARDSMQAISGGIKRAAEDVQVYGPILEAFWTRLADKIEGSTFKLIEYTRTLSGLLSFGGQSAFMQMMDPGIDAEQIERAKEFNRQIAALQEKNREFSDLRTPKVEPVMDFDFKPALDFLKGAFDEALKRLFPLKKEEKPLADLLTPALMRGSVETASAIMKAQRAADNPQLKVENEQLAALKNIERKIGSGPLLAVGVV